MRRNSDAKLVGAAKLAAGAAGAATGVPGAGGLASASTGGLLQSLITRATTRKFERWFSDVAATAEFGSEEDLVRTIQEHLHEPWADEGVTQGFWLSMQVLDPSVMPCLALLGSKYFAEQRAPDHRYQRTGQLLISLTRPELHVLRIVTNLVGDAIKEPNGRVSVRFEETDGGSGEILATWISDPCASDAAPVTVRAWGDEKTPQVLAALRSHRFANSPSPSGVGASETDTQFVDQQFDECALIRLVLTALTPPDPV